MKDLGNFSAMLKSLREKAGLTQSDVAKELGYATAQFISNWERGLSTPPLKSLRALAKIYSVNVDELFEPILQMTLNQTERSLRNEYSRLVKKSGRK